MTRDSIAWWFVMAGSVLTALTGHFELLHQAFPALPMSVDAQFELVALIIGVLAGVMRMSPLPISSEGRIKAIRADPQSSAPTSALQAADAADKAVVATGIAADAADVAHEDAIDKEAGHGPP